MNIENVEIKKETIKIKAGTIINFGLHEDDDYWVTKVDLEAIILKRHPGAIKITIPALNREFRKRYAVKDFQLPEKVFYIHQPY